MKLVDRYLLSEMLWPFVGGLLTFIVLISGHMLFLAIETLVDHHVPLWGVIRYIGYQLPGATIMAMPVATLLASSLALNRLARDHELTALRAGGASPVRLLAPAAGLGAIAMCISLWLSGDMAPRARAAAGGLLRDVVLQQKALVFKPHQFLDTGRGLTLYVEDTDQRNNTVTGLHAFTLRPDSAPILVWAPEAYFGATTISAPYTRSYAAETDGSLTLLESGLAEFDLTRIGGVGSPIRGNQMQDLSLAELQERWRKDAAVAPGAARPYAMEIHSRLAMAVACIVFGLIAGPVTWRFGRGQSFVGVLSTILTIFVFFVLMLWMRVLGTSGAIPVLAAAWGPVLVFLMLAAVGIWRQK